MSPTERTLRTLHTQIEFEMLQAAATAAQATARVNDLQTEVLAGTRSCKATALGLNAALQRPLLNPALLIDVHRAYWRQSSDVLLHREQLSQVFVSEDLARKELHRLQVELRALEQMQRNESKKVRALHEALEAVRADDLWLQRARWADR